MCCLLRHVLHRSVAFKSIIQRGHFPLFSLWSSIFHLCARGLVHWGREFDFKIHWKQLAPSLPSPILFHLPLAFIACMCLLLGLTSGVSAVALHKWGQKLVKACGNRYKSVSNHYRALKQIRRKRKSLMTRLETGNIVNIVVKLLKPDKTFMQTVFPKKTSPYWRELTAHGLPKHQMDVYATFIFLISTFQNTEIMLTLGTQRHSRLWYPPTWWIQQKILKILIYYPETVKAAWLQPTAAKGKQIWTIKLGSIKLSPVKSI